MIEPTKLSTREMKSFIIDQINKVDSGEVSPQQAACHYTGIGRYIAILSLEQEQSRLRKRGEVDDILDFQDSIGKSE